VNPAKIVSLYAVHVTRLYSLILKLIFEMYLFLEIAMCVQTSAVLAEIYLQEMEHKYIHS
jgi:hypothetical protein